MPGGVLVGDLGRMAREKEEVLKAQDILVGEGEVEEVGTGTVCTCAGSKVWTRSGKDM